MEVLMDTLIADVNTSIESVRQIANELRPVLLDKLGLFAALEWLVTELEKKTGVTAYLYADTDQPEISKTLEINIFRICQEALTNITKHAKASLVIIKVENIDKQLSIKIIDNGCGIKSGTLHNPMSMGLLNMKQRANLIGAELNITSSFQTGTTIQFTLNINGKKNINSGRSLSS